MTYVSIPHEADAIQRTETNHEELALFVGDPSNIEITHHGELTIIEVFDEEYCNFLGPGDFLVRHTNGAVHVVQKEVFEREYRQKEAT